jgi:hypothetical protein
MNIGREGPTLQSFTAKRFSPMPFISPKARVTVPMSVVGRIARHDALSRGDAMIRCRLSTLLLVVLAALGLAMVVEYRQAARRMWQPSMGTASRPRDSGGRR